MEASERNGSHRSEATVDDCSSDRTGANQQNPEWRLMKIRRQSQKLENEALMDTSGKEAWTASRRAADKIFKSLYFECVMALTVIFNTALMVIEADLDATCETTEGCTPAWLGIVNKLLLSIYTVDLAGTVYVERQSFIWLWWNWLDVVIVVSGFVEILAYLISPSSRSQVSLLRMLRLFRILRMLRMVRVLRTIPELYKLVTGFAYTMRAMVCGFFILIALVFLWAIVTVEIVGPISKEVESEDSPEWCENAFTSVWHAMLYFFQTLIAGDSWGACALPLARKYEGTFVLFVAVLVTVQLGFMNLLLSVIVDGAAEARGENDRIANLLKMKENLEDVQRLYESLQSIDLDHSGTLSWEEMEQGFDADPNLQERLMSLKLDKESLQMLFKLLEDTETGHIFYFDLIDAIKKAEHDDQRLQFMLMKMRIDKIDRVQDSIAHAVAQLSGAEKGKSLPPSRIPSKSSSCGGDRQPPSVRLQPAPDASALAAATAAASVVLQDKSFIEPRAEAAAQAFVPLALELEYLRSAVEKVSDDMQKRLDAMACEGAGQASRFTQLTETLSEALLMIGHPDASPQAAAPTFGSQKVVSSLLPPVVAAKDASSALRGRDVADATRGLSTEVKGPVFLSKQGGQPKAAGEQAQLGVADEEGAKQSV